jgi:hypothetical protein
MPRSQINLSVFTVGEPSDWNRLVFVDRSGSGFLFFMDDIALVPATFTPLTRHVLASD